MKNKFIKGHWYQVKDSFGDEWVGQYLGRQEGCTCCVCEKGNNAHAFNVWYQLQYDDEPGCNDYETLSFGTEHLPTIIKDLGNPDKTVFVNK